MKWRNTTSLLLLTLQLLCLLKALDAHELDSYHLGRRLTQVYDPGNILALNMPTSPDLTSQPPTAEYAAVCIVAENGQQDIREWLLYHLWLGIGKVYLYDHGSAPPLLSSIEDLVRRGSVEYQYFVGHDEPHGHFIQTARGYAYNDCLLRNRMKHRWMGFLELDEYVVLYESPSNLTAFLAAYEDHGGLGLNWLTFTNTGHEEADVGPPLQHYTHCPPRFTRLNRLLKPFLNPRYTLGFYDNPHTPAFTIRNMTVVTEGFQVASGPATALATHNRVALHRYPCRTEEACSSFVSAVQRAHGSKALPDEGRQCRRGVEVASQFLEQVGATVHWKASPRSTPPATWPKLAVFPRQ